jgi:non-heme chloroperoxidase
MKQCLRYGLLMAISAASFGCSAGPPAPVPPVLQRVTLPTGVSLQYMEAGRPDGSVLILLHGYIDSHQVFEPIVPALAQRYRILAPDQRGHGDSDKPECCYAQADYVADLLAFMRQLDVARATIVGHSMGAFIAHKFAIEHPDRVERLVLVGGAAACTVCAAFTEEIAKVRDPIDESYVRELQKSSMYAPVPDDYFERVIAQSMKVPAHVWHRAFAGLTEEDHADRLAEIRAPTLIVAGDKDGFATEQQQFAQAFPNATLLIYEDTGHWPYVERTERFLTDLLAWLTGH